MKHQLIESAIQKAGGRYPLTVLVQKRMQEMIHHKKMYGTPLPKNILTYILHEIVDDLIYLEGMGRDAERKAQVFLENARKGVMPPEDELPKSAPPMTDREETAGMQRF